MQFFFSQVLLLLERRKSLNYMFFKNAARTRDLQEIVLPETCYKKPATFYFKFLQILKSFVTISIKIQKR